MCHYRAFGSSAQRTDVYLMQRFTRAESLVQERTSSTAIAFVGVRVITGRELTEVLEQLVHGRITLDEYEAKLTDVMLGESLWLDHHLATLETGEVDG